MSGLIWNLVLAAYVGVVAGEECLRYIHLVSGLFSSGPHSRQECGPYVMRGWTTYWEGCLLDT